MRTLFVLAVVAIGLVAAGVIHLQKNGDKVDISIDETKLRQTTAKVVQEGEYLVNEASQTVQQQQQNPNLGRQLHQFEQNVETQAQRLVPVQQQ